MIMIRAVPVNRSSQVTLLLVLGQLFALIKGVLPWSIIGTIKGQYFSDFSGSAIQMTSHAHSIAIHSYDNGSLLKVRAFIEREFIHVLTPILTSPYLK